jgi:hypothetical protein
VLADGPSTGSPVGGAFIGLAAVYVSEFFATLGVPLAEKALGLFSV